MNWNIEKFFLLLDFKYENSGVCLLLYIIFCFTENELDPKDVGNCSIIHFQ